MKLVLGGICRASVAAAGVMVAASGASAEPAAGESADGIGPTPVRIETEFEASAGGGALVAGASVADGPCAFEESAWAEAGGSWEMAIASYLDRFTEDSAEGEAAAADGVTPETAGKELPPGLLEELGVYPGDVVIADQPAEDEVAAAAKPRPAKELPAELVEGLGIHRDDVIEPEPEGEAVVAVDVVKVEPEARELPAELVEGLGVYPGDIIEEPADVLIEVPVAAVVKAEVATAISLAPYPSHPMECEMCRREAVEQATAADDWFWLEELEFVEPAATQEQFEVRIED
jgi:hypothetical protein